jgi:general stress protein 26
METKLSEEAKRKHVKEMVQSFDTAMLVTHTLDGAMRSRPLAIAHDRGDDALYFSTDIDSDKVRELEANPGVNLVLQDGRRFVSLTGIARVERDRAVIDRVWSESWKVWFPQGKADPALCVVVVEPREASYWDGSGLKGLKYLFEMAKGYVTHTRPESDGDEEHTGHVKM